MLIPQDYQDCVTIRTDPRTPPETSTPDPSENSCSKCEYWIGFHLLQVLRVFASTGLQKTILKIDRTLNGKIDRNSRFLI